MDKTVRIFKLNIPLRAMTLTALLIGVVIRLWQFGTCPGGINQDEAYAGYEAFSMLKYGTDSWGYRFPVYFISWGSGMNVLNSYLMIPLVAIFGLNAYTVRAPQLIMSIVTLAVFYLLVKKLYGEKAATLGLFLLSVCPWHIMMSRWGLESNLAPAFLLLGLYFFISGVDNEKKFVLSAMFYGLSLYSYATVWPVVPAVIILNTAYLIYVKKIKFSRYTVTAAIIIFVMALPLILFLLVNKGIIGEIKTQFLSVPKLPVMRENEISFNGFSQKVSSLYTAVVKQNDGLIWNSTEKFGIYYYISAPFILLGLAFTVKSAAVSVKKRTLSGSVFILSSFVTALILGCLVNVNVNRINCIHLIMVLFCTVGLYFAVGVLKPYFKYVGALFAAAYFALFVSFSVYYFTDYRNEINTVFQSGLGEAVEYAEKSSCTVYVSREYLFPKILFYTEFPTDEYIDTVILDGYPKAYMYATSFGRFRFVDSTGYQNRGTYIIPSRYALYYEENGYAVKIFDGVAVAVKE